MDCTFLSLVATTSTTKQLAIMLTLELYYSSVNYARGLFSSSSAAFVALDANLQLPAQSWKPQCWTPFDFDPKGATESVQSPR